MTDKEIKRKIDKLTKVLDRLTITQEILTRRYIQEKQQKSHEDFEQKKNKTTKTQSMRS